MLFRLIFKKISLEELNTDIEFDALISPFGDLLVMN